MRSFSKLWKIMTTVFFACAFNNQTSGGEAVAVRMFQENRACAALPCKQAEHAIVFVHGLTGSRETWQHANQTYWPKLISDDDKMSEFDVFRIDYDSFARGESPDVDAIDDLFYDQLKRLVDYKSITFIAHSLGGLIVQRYLQHVNNLDTHIMLNKYRIVILLGTPSEGSDLARYAEWLSKNPTLRILKDYKGNDYLKLLGKQMWYTMQKHDITGCSSLRFFAAYEGLDTGPIRVVQKSSATARAFACKKFERDHIALAKPSSGDDVLYTSVRDLLRACIAGREAVCPKPKENSTCGQSNHPLEDASLQLSCNYGTWDQVLIAR